MSFYLKLKVSDPENKSGPFKTFRIKEPREKLIIDPFDWMESDVF